MSIVGNGIDSNVVVFRYVLDNEKKIKIILFSSYLNRVVIILIVTNIEQRLLLL